VAALAVLIGRAGETAHLRRLVTSRSAAGVVLVGSAGVGKTRLAREVVASLDPRRYRVSWAAGTESARHVTYGALAALLPLQPTAASHNFLRAAAEALGVSGDGRRCVLVVDDAHQLDPASAALVAHVVRTTSAAVLCVVRSDLPVPDALLALWKDEVIPRVELGPLSPEAATAIGGAFLGGELAERTAAALWRLSRGNALLLREVLLAGQASGALAERGGLWWLDTAALGSAGTPRLTELIWARMGHLTPRLRTAVELVALAEPIGAVLLSRLVAASAVEEAEERGLVTSAREGSRTVLHLGHPLYGEVILRRASPIRLSRLRRELADVTAGTGMRRRGDRLRVALWRLEASVAQPPGDLIAAAQAAWAGADIALATRLTRAAVAAGGGFDALIQLGTLLLVGEDQAEEAEQVCRAAGAQAGTEAQRAEAIRLRLLVDFQGDRVDAGLTMAVPEIEDLHDPLVRQDVGVAVPTLYAYAGHGDRAIEMAVRVRDWARPTRVVEGQLAAAEALAFGHLGQTARAIAVAEDVLTDIDDWGAQVPHLCGAIYTGKCFAEIFAGLTAAAIGTAQSQVKRYADGGWRIGTSVALATLALALRQHGDVAGALRAAREAAQISHSGHFAELCQAELAHAAALAGDLVTARAALAAATAAARKSTGLHAYWTDLARARLVAAEEGPAAAVWCTLDVAAAARADGMPTIELIALHEALRLGHDAAVVVHRLEALPSDVDGEFAPACAAHAAAGRDAHALLAVADRFAGLGLPLHGADAALQAARAADGSGLSKLCRARARELFDRCPGLRAPREADGLPALTRRQRQVAQLAAAGHSSRDIAARLGASVRTVDNHLHAVYARLGVRSRTELATYLGLA
jgi:DNA-binding NarL/FixJ family response regulator